MLFGVQYPAGVDLFDIYLQKILLSLKKQANINEKTSDKCTFTELFLTFLKRLDSYLSMFKCSSLYLPKKWVFFTGSRARWCSLVNLIQDDLVSGLPYSSFSQYDRFLCCGMVYIYYTLINPNLFGVLHNLISSGRGGGKFSTPMFLDFLGVLECSL